MTRTSISVTAMAALFLSVALGAPVLAQGDAPGGAAAKPMAAMGGEAIYRSTCQACHMADAKGGSGAAVIPALAGNPKLGVAAYPITIVLIGKGAMPGFTEYLTPAQIAEVITYARTHFGNTYAKPVTEADVLKIADAKPHR
jgi:mono/diheme cytochrome c family protein